MMKIHVFHMTCSLKTFTTQGFIISARYSNKYIKKKDFWARKICQTSAEARSPEDHPPATNTLSLSSCLDIVVVFIFLFVEKVFKIINLISSIIPIFFVLRVCLLPILVLIPLLLCGQCNKFEYN